MLVAARHVTCTQLLKFSIGKTKTDAKFLSWRLSFYKRHPFRSKKKKKEQQVTLFLFGVGRRSIAAAEASVHGQITGKTAVSLYLSSSRYLIAIKITDQCPM